MVQTELDLAITFLLVAATTNDQATANRNIINARRAYTAAAYFFADLSGTQNADVKKKFIRLEALLAQFSQRPNAATRAVGPGCCKIPSMRNTPTRTTL
jgi:hypothetical protein